jgi:hypothetical protein
MIQLNFTVGVRGSISNVDRTDPLSFTSTIKDLVITSRINLDRIRKVSKVVANRTFEAHDLILCSYCSVKFGPLRWTFLVLWVPRLTFSAVSGFFHNLLGFLGGRGQSQNTLTTPGPVRFPRYMGISRILDHHHSLMRQTSGSTVPTSRRPP